MQTREDAWNLLTEYVESPSLRKHCLAVEAAMRAYAGKLGGDPELWGMTGLLHDFDYEKHPRGQDRGAIPDLDLETEPGHPFEGVRVLRRLGYPEEMLEAILGHALYSGVPRETPMAKALFACDELCGFIVAMAYMRPDKFDSITPDAIRKALKKKKFAEKVSREDIAQGTAELSLPEDEHFETVAGALRAKAESLGF